MNNYAESADTTVTESRDSYLRIKVLLISLAYFFVIGANTLLKDLRDSIFMSIVGREYIWRIKPLSMIILIPAILFHSYLIDRIRRYELLSLYAFLYGTVTLLLAYYVGHETIGIANTDTSSNRFFGWIVYFVIEGYTPFIVSVFWAFVNSVFSPEEAKNNYSYMISVSKVGGMAAAAFAYVILSGYLFAGQQLDHVYNHQILLAVTALMLFAVPVVLYFLMKTVPGRYLHGYEAVYLMEKQRKHDHKEKTGIFSGLELLVKWPYIFGIFGMIFFYEISHTVFSYLRLGFVQKAGGDISGVSAMLFQQVFVMHFIGLLISMIGTRALLRRLGERYCLLLIPISVVGLLFYFMTSQSANAVLITFILLRALNYAFFKPVIESLYIPTLKDVKFKSKSWIDAFGTKLAKTTGAAFNGFVELSAPALAYTFHVGFFGVIAVLWVGTAYVLGKRFAKAIETNEVIGAE